MLSQQPVPSAVWQNTHACTYVPVTTNTVGILGIELKRDFPLSVRHQFARIVATLQ